MYYINPKTGATIGYQETKGTTAESFIVPLIWQPSTLSFIQLTADTNGNLNVTGGSGTSASGGNAAAGSTSVAVPAFADYTGWSNNGTLVGVSTSAPLPCAIYNVVTSTVSGAVTTYPSGTTTIVGLVSSAISGGTVTTVPSGTTTITGLVTSTPSGTTTITGLVTSAISGTVTTAVTNTVTVAGTVTTSPSGTTTITGLVTSAVNLYQVAGVGIALGQTTAAASFPVVLANNATVTVTGTVTSAPSGTTTITGTVSSTVTNTVTSTITGTVTSAVNLYQVNGVGYALGTHVAVSSMPVVLASDGLGGASTTPLQVLQQPLTKGTQATTGVMTQSMHDAGRTYMSFVLDNVTGITSEALATTTINKGGATSAATTYQVTAGKTLRVTAFLTSVMNSTTTMSASRVRVRHSTSTVNATSAIVIANQDSAVAALANSVGIDDTIIPEAVEIPSGSTIGITHIETATTCVVSANLLGYEY